MVDDRGQAEVSRRIAKDGVVPKLEIRVVLDQVRERLPLVGGREDARAVSADGGRLRVRRLEGVLGPRQRSVVRLMECGRCERSGVRLARSNRTHQYLDACTQGAARGPEKDRTHRRRVDGEEVLAVGACREQADLLLDAGSLAGGSLTAGGGRRGVPAARLARVLVSAAAENTAKDGGENDGYSDGDTNPDPFPVC